MSGPDKHPAASNPLLSWQDTTAGLTFIILFDVLVTYGFASWAIDSGRLIAYFLAIVFLALAIIQGVKLFKKVARHG